MAGSVMVKELKQYNIMNEFDSHWVTNISGLMKQPTEECLS